MKRVLLGLLLGPVLGFGQPRPAATADRLVLTHVTVIDATGSASKPDMSVEVRGHRIVLLGPTAKMHLSADVQVVDATGKFLIPGLWDMHVHTGQRDIYLPLSRVPPGAMEAGTRPHFGRGRPEALCQRARTRTKDA